MTETWARLHAIIYGHVQGVSFRFYTQRQAQALNLTGWVANRWDETVEVVAEGPRPALDQLLTFLRRGPSMARVEQVEFDYWPATREFDRFEIEL
jgi:acylphosphatase